MRRVSWASRVWRASRSKTFGKVVGASAAGALIIGIAAAGTTEASAAAPDASNPLDRVLQAQSTGAVSKSDPNQLSVTVGKAVSITTDATGNPSLKALVTNTQVSGQGAGKLYVPVGTASPTSTSSFGGLQTQGDSIVYNVNSTSNEVQNLHASGGMFSGQEAISLKVKAWLDGKEISADQLYNITGDVKLEYTFTNNTVKKMPITYKNSQGQSVTTDMDIPVPLGASFATTFGNGWGDINAPWANTGISPTGQQLNGTVVLFPPLGADTKTLTVEARAQNATLPSSQTTAIPINLGTYSGGILLTALPAAANGASEITGLAGTATQKLLFYQQMLAKYSSVVAELDRTKVQPLVNLVNSIKINPQEVSKAVDLLTAAVDIAGLYMKANSAIASVDETLAGGMAKAFRSGASVAESIGDGLNGVSTQIQNAVSDIKALVAVITNPVLLAIIKGVDYVVGKELTLACSALQTMNGRYSTDIQTALQTASSSYPQLGDLKSGLDAQTLLGQPGQGNLTTALNNCSDDSQFIQDIVNRLIDPQTGIAPLITDLGDALDNLVGPGGLIPSVQATAYKLAATLPQWAQKLDNPNCPNNIYQASVNNCGVKQIAALIAAGNDKVAQGLFDDLAPLTQNLKQYIPGIIKLDHEVTGLVNVIGGAVAAAPTELEKFANLLGGVVPLTGKVADLGGGLADKLAIMNASMVAMNERSQAGDGVPYGNATGVGNPQTLAAWQINMNGANRNTTQDVFNLCAALLLFVIGAGVGTAMYVRRKP